MDKEAEIWKTHHPCAMSSHSAHLTESMGAQEQTAAPTGTSELLWWVSFLFIPSHHPDPHQLLSLACKQHPYYEFTKMGHLLSTHK